MMCLSLVILILDPQNVMFPNKKPPDMTGMSGGVGMGSTRAQMTSAPGTWTPGMAMG